MELDRRMRPASIGAAAPAHTPAPGKRTLTEGLAEQRSEAAVSKTGIQKPLLPAQTDTALNTARPTLQMLFGVPRAVAAPAEDPVHVHAAAARGTATSASPLPYADQIQRAFGRHDISTVRAHVGPEATASARAMGARAYATGDHIVLGDGADLHTVAHEAAHVVQQRAGVQLKGGVGAADDVYERHADTVADAVVAGRSAESLLDQHAGSGSTGAVQRKKFSFKVENEDQRQNRPTPEELMEHLGTIHDVLPMIREANDMELRFVVDYTAGPKKHGGTKIAHIRGVTMFLVRVYWEAKEPLYTVEATFLHEVVMHVLPAVRLHNQEKKNETLSAKTFPNDEEVILNREALEHNDEELWLEALKTAKKLNKGVVQETVQDMVEELGLEPAAKVCAKAKMPFEVFNSCLESTFAQPSNNGKSKEEGEKESKEEGKKESKDDDL